MKKKIIIGNWKMNPNTVDDARRTYRSIRNLSKRLSNVHTVICPPFVFIPLFKSTQGYPIGLGAQNVYFEEQGPYTGEISASMLKGLGVKYVIVGHSERRAMGETDEIVSKKIQILLQFGIHPILCVGESVHDAHGDYLEVLKNQIKNSLAKVQKKYSSQLILAYEPIWEIGAKESMNPETILEMSLFVKKVLSDIFGHDQALATPILYGGAVNFRNAGDIITKGKVDGLLVGRESLNRPGFSALLKTVDSL